LSAPLTTCERPIGRHKPAEIVALGTRSIAAIAEYLGTKPFLFGNEPTGIDATIFAFVAGTLCPHFKHRCEPPLNATPISAAMLGAWLPTITPTVVR
jgi:hypothetical protein